MKVLLIVGNTGDQQELNRLMTDLLDEVGTPYDVFDASTQTLTPATLISGTNGHYANLCACLLLIKRQNMVKQT